MSQNSPWVPALGVACSIAVIGAGIAWSRVPKATAEERSTTSSAGGGALAYETKKAVHEYLQMHYATPEELFPYADAPKVGHLAHTPACSLSRIDLLLHHAPPATPTESTQTCSVASCTACLMHRSEAQTFPQIDIPHTFAC